MKTIHAATALLPSGWAQNVRVSINDDGRIAGVDCASDSCADVACQSDMAGKSDNAVRLNEEIRSDDVSWQNMSADTEVDVLLPAPVNLHSHAFQRAMAGLTESRGPDASDSFWTWRRLMYQFLEQLSPDDVEAITAFVHLEMLEAGYASSVEFHYLHHQAGGKPYDNPAEMSVRIAAAAKASGIGLTLLPVHYQFGGCDQRAVNAGQKRFATDQDGFSRLWSCASSAMTGLPADSVMGVAPHSLRAVARESLAELVQIAPAKPFHLHAAEQLAEVEEVQHYWGARPIEWLLENTAMDKHWCLIHCTQMTAQETRALASSGAVAGLCPITESSLGDGIFDGVNYLAYGGAIGIGSDSNIRISLNEELRTLEYSQRLRDHSRAALATQAFSTGRRLFDSIVKGGAMAAGRQSGHIATGYWADLLALDGQQPDLDRLSGDTLLDAFIFAGNDRMVSEVWCAGRHQVAAGRHVNREAIVQRYREVTKSLR